MVKYVHDGDDAGWSFGQAVTDKISFFGVTPVVQQATIADATNTTTTTSTTTALTTDLDSLRTKFNTLLSQLEALGLNASA